MKRPGNWLVMGMILAMGSLVACSQGGSAPGRMNCSFEGEVCIHIDAVESFAWGDPLTIKIEVTSTKDFSDLSVSLPLIGVTMDGPENWEPDLSTTLNEPGLAVWAFAIQAGQTLTFERVLHFPPEEGWYDVQAEVVNTGRTIVGIDSFDVLLLKEGGLVIRAGAPRPPFTPNITSPAYGPGTPVPTRVPARPWPWELTHEPATDTPVPPIEANTTPTQPAYPMDIATPNTYLYFPYP